MIFVDNSPIEFTRFPNGETKCPIITTASSSPVVTLKYEDDSDLVKLLFVRRALRGTLPTLLVTYMPYSRMDRVEHGSPFTLKYVSEFINSLSFERVEVIEPHSDVTLALLDNSTALHATNRILGWARREIGFKPAHDFIFLPDAGAEKRYHERMKDYRTLIGLKHRDFATGRITSYEVLNLMGEPESTSRVVIIDDLCSAGGTFVLAANKLIEQGFKSVYLVVAHCEQTVMRGEIPTGKSITHVFTSDSMLPADFAHPLFTVYPIHSLTT